MTPEQIVQEITKSGLRGRGGGGFPTGRKWEAARVQKSAKKYVICNADEGDPGAFMNRSVMEGNPHSVIEGLMIAARAIGADETLIYVRTEYPLAVAAHAHAPWRTREARGFLGDERFRLRPAAELRGDGRRGRICLRRRNGDDRLDRRPARHAAAQAAVPGAERSVGQADHHQQRRDAGARRPHHQRRRRARSESSARSASPGTKTFALTGHVANTGLVEVPFGTTLREVVLNIGGGITDRRGKVKADGFKAVQIGGPSGGCLTQEHLDLPLDYDSLRSVGAMVGSGGLVAMNQNTCMVSIARFFMDFTQRESCGKCVLCREGTRQMLALLDDIIEGRATGETLVLLEKLALGRAERLALRAGQDRAESGALDAALFPRGIRRARVSQALSDRPMQGAGQAQH